MDEQITHLVTMVVTESLEDHKVPVVKPAEQLEFIPKLGLPLRALEGGTLDSHQLAILQSATVDMAKATMANAIRITELLGGLLQLL